MIMLEPQDTSRIIHDSYAAYSGHGSDQVTLGEALAQCAEAIDMKPDTIPKFVLADGSLLTKAGCNNS